MTTITLKQVTSTGSDLHIVAMGTDIVHDTVADRLSVIKDHLTLKTYDLTLGTVFMMNDNGRTIEKYERSKDKPTTGSQSPKAIMASPFSSIFTFNEKRYITIENLTYRIPKDKSIQLIAITSNGVTVTTTRVDNKTVLEKTSNLLKIFPHQYTNIANVIVGQGMILEEFTIRHVNEFARLSNDRYLSNDEKLQLFGVNFNPSPDLIVHLKGNYYSCGLDGTMHLLSVVGVN